MVFRHQSKRMGEWIGDNKENLLGTRKEIDVCWGLAEAWKSECGSSRRGNRVSGFIATLQVQELTPALSKLAVPLPHPREVLVYFFEEGDLFFGESCWTGCAPGGVKVGRPKWVL